LSSAAPPRTSHGFFITGTDTGVGKTLIACALLRAYAASGARVVGMKPVAAGAARMSGQLVNGDVEALIAAGNVRASREHINPYCFEPPIAPHVAARLAGVEIELTRMRSAYDALAAQADRVIVEGAGGFCIPLNARETSVDLAQHLGLPLILVVGMRLGCLNHALLTVQAITASGLRLAGWVANHMDAHMAHATDNVDALAERIAAPCIARIAHGVHSQLARITAQLDIALLR
jgi:dethiobiotin synthetase